MSELLNLIDESLKYSLYIVHRPTGFFLSGGIDSTTLVMLGNKYGPVTTFSSVFPGTSVNESKYVRSVIEACSGGTHYIFTPPTPSKEDMEILKQIHGYDVPPSVYVQFKVLEYAASKGMKAMIDGQGPDEMFGGYLWYQAVYVKTLLRNRHYGRALYELLGSLYHHWDFWVVSFKKYRKGQTQQYNKVLDIPIDELMLNDLLKDSLPEELVWLRDNAAYWGIEVISPYCVDKIVDYAKALPMDQKIRFGTSKWILRQATKGLVPEMVRNRQDKLGFPAPEEWK